MVQQFLERCLCLDLETPFGGHRLAQRILRIGAVFRGKSFAWDGETPLPEALRALDRFGAKADYVLGHNLLGHYLLVLEGARDAAGALPALLSKPVIDTLVLSPPGLFPAFLPLLAWRGVIHSVQSSVAR